MMPELNLNLVLKTQTEIELLSREISQIINESSTDFESLKENKIFRDLKSSYELKKEELKQHNSLIKNPLKKWYNLLPGYEKAILNKSVILKEDLSEVEQSILSINAKELDDLNKIRGKLSRLFLSPFQKHQKRLNLLGLSHKFSDDGDNALRYGYGVLYLKLLCNMENSKVNDSGLQEVYDYLDEKDFQYVIPKKYLEKLESYPELLKLINEMKPIMKRLSS